MFSLTAECIIKLQGIYRNHLKKLREQYNFYVTDPPVSTTICRLDFSCFVSIQLHIKVFCIGNVLVVRPVDQQQRQLKMRLCSNFYIMRSRTTVLAREIKRAMEMVEAP